MCVQAPANGNASTTFSTPTIKTCTHNFKGLNFLDKKPGARLRKAANVRFLAETHDSVFMQETHLGPRAFDYIKTILPVGFRCFSSNLTFKSSGVSIILSPDLLSRYTPHRITLPPELKGKAIALELTPMGDGHTITLVNVYLQTGDNFALKQSQIQHLRAAIPAADFMILGGDFNFVEDRSRDTSSASRYYVPTDDFVRAWSGFKDHFSLKEVCQLTHTYFDLNSTMPRSSRLDRIYISHSEADWAVTAPYAYIPCMPHTILHTTTSPCKTKSDGDKLLGVSDHLPVTLAFRPHQDPEETRGPSIPRWVADDPEFQKFFELRWESLAIHLNADRPFHLLSCLKGCMYEAAHDVLVARRKKTATFTSTVSELTLLLKALRCHQNPTAPHSAFFLERHPSVDNQDVVRSRIAQLLEKAEIEQPPGEGGEAVSPPPAGNKKMDRIKLILPSTRTRLCALRPDLDTSPTTDPDEMAKIAATYFGTIWGMRARGDDCREPEDYYGDFGLDVPEGVRPVIPTLEQIEEAIAATSNSSSGPDGIPFAAWRAVKKHAAPVLLLVLEALASGVLPPEGFNHGLLFLIPKKGTLLPCDTRPISVTNADNRIIAKAVVAAITPALLATLHASQKGFVKGRHFEDHIRELNENFYAMLEDGEEGDNYFILFMDTAKAFDSIDHCFIHEAIRRTGLPAWFSRLVVGLLHDVRVRPAFRGAGAHWIHIHRGVKQGCPLSPLLFVICYDVLLRRIASLDDADPFACADDLAVASACFRSLWPVMCLVDAFRKASGLGINTDKTRIVSARSSDIARYIRPTTIHECLQRCPWPDVLEAAAYKYLGILIGRDVTVPDIYRVAIRSLCDRALTYLPVFRHLSHASRVLAFNVFIITKISYLVKFFHIPFTQRASACAEGTIKEQARRLILPVLGAYPYCFLIAPPHLASPGNPVRDAWALSMSTLIDQSDLWEWQGDGATDGSVKFVPGDKDSMRISRHIRSAAADFVCRVTAATDAAFDAAAFDNDNAHARRQAIYWWLVKTDYEADVHKALAGVLTRRALTHCDALVPQLHKNFSLLPSHFPSHHRCAQFDLITNSLFTHRRFHVLDGGEIPPCYLCGKGEDSIRHLYGGECEVVCSARAAVAGALKFYSDEGHRFPSLNPDALGAADFWSASLLAFPRPGR